MKLLPSPAGLGDILPQSLPPSAITLMPPLETLTASRMPVK